MNDSLPDAADLQRRVDYWYGVAADQANKVHAAEEALATAEARIAQIEDWDVRKFFAAIPPDVDGLTHEDGWTLMRREAAEKLKADLAQYREALRELVEEYMSDGASTWDDAWERAWTGAQTLLATRGEHE